MKDNKMLVENYEDKVKIVKLNNGEEIIAYTSIINGKTIIKRPLMAVLGANPQNPAQAQVSFCPWLICGNTNTDIEIPSDKILVIVDPEPMATNQYIASVGDIRG